MRVLVTGDRGYIGSVLVPMLQREGFSVVGLDAGWFDACDFTPPWTRYERRTGDALDLQARDLEGFDAVVHLAGLPTGAERLALNADGLGGARGSYDMENAGVVDLAGHAQEAGLTRFIHVTANGVISDQDSANRVPQDIPRLLLHRVSKRSTPAPDVDRALFATATAKFRPLSLGNAIPYGSSPQLRLDTLLNNLVATALLTGSVTSPIHPQSRRPFVHVKDISRAVIAALRLPPHQVGGGRFDIVRRRDLVPMSTALAHIAAITTATTEVTAHLARGPTPAGDILVPALPGYRPRFRLPDGIRELCRAISRSGIGIEALEDARFDRQRFLAGLATNGATEADLQPPP